MAANDFNFSAEAAENCEQKCLCVLVLDVSGSMYGKPIAELNNGLRDFLDEIGDDETTSQRLEVALVAFNHDVKVVQQPALVENVDLPELKAGGTTAMANAVSEAIDLVEARKSWYKETCQPYYRPWIILMTDGEPDEDQDMDSLAARIKNETENKHFMFLPIAIGDANMEVLAKIASDKIRPMQLQGTKFSSFFKWLSASIGTVVSHEEGEKVDISNGMDDWMKSFEI